MAGIPGKGGLKGRSGPPGNQNAFRHGLAAIEKRQDTGLLAPPDESIRRQILDGLISDKGGERQMSTVMRSKTSKARRNTRVLSFMICGAPASDI